MGKLVGNDKMGLFLIGELIDLLDSPIDLRTIPESHLLKATPVSHDPGNNSMHIGGLVSSLPFSTTFQIKW